jgi:hypothetical protein
VMLSILINIYWRFEGTRCCHLQGRRLRRQVPTKRAHPIRYTASHPKRPYTSLGTCWSKFCMHLLLPSCSLRAWRFWPTLLALIQALSLHLWTASKARLKECLYGM